MRVRLATLLALFLIVLPATQVLGAVVASADPGGPTLLAQENVDETGNGGGEGQSDADTETGAGEEENAPAVEEEGPVWTYQMAKIVIALLLLMSIGVGLAYYKLVVQRQRTGI